MPNTSGRHLEYEKHEMARRATVEQKTKHLQDERGTTSQQDNMTVNAQVNMPLTIIDDQ